MLEAAEGWEHLPDIPVIRQIPAFYHDDDESVYKGVPQGLVFGHIVFIHPSTVYTAYPLQHGGGAGASPAVNVEAHRTNNHAYAHSQPLTLKRPNKLKYCGIKASKMMMEVVVFKLNI